MSLIATLSMVGCICPPAGYHSGMYRSGYSSSHIAYQGPCDPCGPAETGCGVVEYGGNPCLPQSYTPRVMDCRSSLTNLTNGVFLVGRGVLDVTAAPFVALGSLMSSGCRYEVLSICPEVSYGSYGGSCYTTTEPCGPAACSPCSPGCDTCANGYTEGIRYNAGSKNWAAAIPPPPRLSSSVIQASYQEPTAPAARFVQPMR
jgi:hypothetical protein